MSDPQVITAAELLKTKRVTFTKATRGHMLVLDDGFEYPIAWDRIDTAGKCLHWIMHLSEKTWVTTDHLREVAELAAERFGFDVHGPL